MGRPIPATFRAKMSVVRIGDQVLYPEDIALIRAPCWWNDNLISFWIEHIRRDLSERLYLMTPSVIFLLSMMHTKEDAADLFASANLSLVSHVIVPINSHFSTLTSEAANAGTRATPGTHWSVLVGSLAESRFMHFDSLPGSPNACAAEHVASKLGGAFAQLANSSVAAGEVPVQPNSYDCGPYSCSVMHQLCTAGPRLQLEGFHVDESLCRHARKAMSDLVFSRE